MLVTRYMMIYPSRRRYLDGKILVGDHHSEQLVLIQSENIAEVDIVRGDGDHVHLLRTTGESLLMGMMVMKVEERRAYLDGRALQIDDNPRATLRAEIVQHGDVGHGCRHVHRLQDLHRRCARERPWRNVPGC